MSKTSNVLKPVNADAYSASTAGSKSASHKNAQGNMSIGTSSKDSSQNGQLKKIPRKSSKPIITWFQRKLAGTVRVKRSDAMSPGVAALGIGSAPHTTGRTGRTASSPLPQSTSAKRAVKRESTSATHRTTISLTEDEGTREDSQSFNDDATSLDRSSFARDSLWSPQSALEADDDASVRPIPPSAPPSPSPSRSSSSVLSNPRTFRSMAASTKPTTVLSIELGNGMAHIAQVPPNASPNPVHRIAPHIRHSSSLSNSAHLNSGNSIAFSAFSATQNQSQPPSVRNFGSISSLNFGPTVLSSSPHVQAPLHTSHHPRNNPRPSSPPLDNASVLTLASSAYAMPPRSSGTHAYSIAIPGLGDAGSHYAGSMVFPDGESTSQYLLGDDDRLDDRDIDASVRALRPRSSRRGSWESEVSRWSARVQTRNGTPSLVRERSLWTTNSVRTGAFSTEIPGELDTSKEDDHLSENTDIKVEEPEFLAVEGPDSSNTKEQEAKAGPLPLPLEEGRMLHRPSTETIGNPIVPTDSSITDIEVVEPKVDGQGHKALEKDDA
ncbi:hypothetical protein FA15DRAFT_664245 [Coprinopsis marcescibilis]|uniref:Uncharacterized protein n=1 Tax=Coprinopsis marcescibilis TaxID=230819 RepID=A0A5C3L9G8_COPMA|nr:hypothetical protein FA15DRAFT_664245 [Coprinopsis marcescibilis]